MMKASVLLFLFLLIVVCSVAVSGCQSLRVFERQSYQPPGPDLWLAVPRR